MTEQEPQQVEEEIQVERQDPTRPLSPVQFFAPNATPDGNKDFRPTAIHTFKNTEDDHDDHEEDGHGNFKQTNTDKPRHPSERREPKPYERQFSREPEQEPTVPVSTTPPATEEPEASEPKQAPGIAGSKQVQPSDE